MTKIKDGIFDKFNSLVNKYAKTSKKEATDVLFERHTHRWLVGTIDKYTFRYANLARERDLLKIATYMYILWLKRGYYLSPNGTSIVKCTTVKTKAENFDKFLKNVPSGKLKIRNTIKVISDQMRKWSRKAFVKISQREIYLVYITCFVEWHKKFSKNAGKDTDTWNEIVHQLKK